MNRILEGLWLHRDTCNVYVLEGFEGTVLVDFGDGSVLDGLGAKGLKPVTDVLVTHHHRDNVQGVARAVARGARVWVPHAEQDLFQAVDAHWRSREVWVNYNSREDRFSLLEPVRVAGTLRDEGVKRVGGLGFRVLPTPGHTTGSVSLICTLGGRRVAFVGDLIRSGGRLHSLAATQWTYNGGEGIAGTILSLLALRDLEPEILLPSHGEPILEPDTAIDLTVDRLLELLRLRGHNPRLLELRDQPYVRLTDHLLMNRTSVANAYVLRSDSGKALLFDFGYDFFFGEAPGADRAARRPWLYTVPALKRDFNLSSLDVVMPTHYHDDHVAGINLLREVEGTQVWAAETFADVLERPARYNLPCLWREPIRVDRALSLEVTIPWQEFELTLHALPGHTRHAVAISLVVDGVRVLVSGDQYAGDDGLELNYVYGNEFDPSDYVTSAKLYTRLRPELILTGHWAPRRVQPGYIESLLWRGEALERLHRELLPPEVFALGSSGAVARIRPYQIEVAPHEAFTLEVEVQNPFESAEDVHVTLALPGGWTVDPPGSTLHLAPHTSGTLEFRVVPDGVPVYRARVAADVTIGETRFGQHAEALVTVEEMRDV